MRSRRARCESTQLSIAPGRPGFEEATMSVTSTTEKQKTTVDPAITTLPTAASAKQEKKPAIDLNFSPQSPPPDLRAFYDAALNPTMPATSITAHNACVKDYATAGHIAGHVAGELLAHKLHVGLPASIVVGFATAEGGGAVGHKVGEKMCPPIVAPDFLPNVPKTTTADKTTSSTASAPTSSLPTEPLMTSADPSKNVCK
jgi:hypothetical protein